MKASHLKPLLAAAIVLSLLPSTRAYLAKGGTEDAAESVIAGYRADDPAARVKFWQAEITHPSGNLRFGGASQASDAVARGRIARLGRGG